MKSYHPPWLHRHAHLSTILPNQLRPIVRFPWKMRRFDTPDGDFFDVGTQLNHSRHAAILLHGLEGSCHSQYMHGMANALSELGLDIWAVNHRGCSGTPNMKPHSYHSGFTRDLNQLVIHLSSKYEGIAVVGFSLGGNIALKWAGSAANDVSHNVRSVVGVSVPCDLADSARELGRPSNRIYLLRFLRQLKQKALQKAREHPNSGLDEQAIRTAKNFYEFDDAYTAPANGFQSAMDYYNKCSSVRFLTEINIPTHIIQAANDSFLGPRCYPVDLVRKNPMVEMITSQYGGHVGFAQNLLMRGAFWHELLASEIIMNELRNSVAKKT